MLRAATFALCLLAAGASAAQTLILGNLATVAPTCTITGGCYSSSFPLTETTICQGGIWYPGGPTTGSGGGTCDSLANGLDWQNVQTTGGLATGAGPANTPGDVPPFTDPTAILSGTWGASQSFAGTVNATGTATASCCHEVEARLLATISAHSISGYEINCSLYSGDQYVSIVRWNGALNNFTVLNTATNYCQNGDTLSATVSSSTHVITAYITHGGIKTQIVQATDSTYTTGNPGIGFWDDQDTNWTNQGFTSITITSSP